MEENYQVVFGLITMGFIISIVLMVFISGIYFKRKVKAKLKKNYYITADTLHSLEDTLNKMTFKKKDIEKEIELLEAQLKEKQENLDKINSNIEIKQSVLEKTIENVNTQIQIEKTMEETSRKAFQSFCEILEKDYEQKDKEYEEKLAQCKLKFDTAKTKEQNELDRLKNIRKAMQEAQLREEQLSEKQDFYRLIISNDELNDVLLFEELKSKVKNKRAVSMLIWSTWYQKPMTELCNKILGTKTVCGIYKITNIKNNRCYIGQAVDVATRFKSHAKCGLGIDTPANNKLYAAMQKDGLSNFTWELLEECKKEELNERERYYIEAYMSKDYGYNSNIGVK